MQVGEIKLYSQITVNRNAMCNMQCAWIVSHSSIKLSNNCNSSEWMIKEIVYFSFFVCIFIVLIKIFSRLLLWTVAVMIFDRWSSPDFIRTNCTSEAKKKKTKTNWIEKEKMNPLSLSALLKVSFKWDMGQKVWFNSLPPDSQR